MPSYAQVIERARARWLRGQAATARDLREIYQRALDDVIADIRASHAPSSQTLTGIATSLQAARDFVTERTLRATILGLQIAASSGTNGSAEIAQAQFGRYMPIGAIQASYDAINERAVLAFATRTRFDGLMLSDRIWLHGQSWERAIRTTLESAVAQGQAVVDIARTLDAALAPGIATSSSLEVRRRLKLPGDISHQSVRLARTEMANAYREGTILGHSKTPGYLGIIWEISGAHPFEDECDDLADGEDGNGFWSAANEPDAPHPNCLVGGQIVRGERPLAATARWYSGDVIEIRTAEGRRLTVTPNHPVLTSQGWVRAACLDKGSDLICSRLGETAAAGVDPHDHQVPALVEDVAIALGCSSPMASVSMPTAAEDFHGDGEGSEVCVVGTDRFLRNGVDPAAREPLSELTFGFGDADLSRFTGGRSLTQTVPRVLVPPSSDVRGAGIGRVLLGSEARLVKRDGLLDRAPRHTSVSENSVDRVAGYRMPSRDALDRFAGDVGTDEVVDVRRVPFNGHVYNLQTPCGWFVAEGIVVHNCMCQTLPQFESGEMMSERIGNWLNDPSSEPALEDYHQSLLNLDLPTISVSDVTADLTDALRAPNLSEAKRIGRRIAERVRKDL